MRGNKIWFQVFGNFLLGSMVSCTALTGSTTTSVDASAGANTCAQTDGTAASCGVSTPAGVNGPETASASATANWFSGGTLEAFASAKGPYTTATASVDFSAQIFVAGASGSGDLIVTFEALNGSFNQSPATGTVSLITVKVGGASATALPEGLPNEYYATLPVTFGTLLPFNVLFSASATGTQFHDGTFGTGIGDEILPELPGFSITDANGAYVPGAIVEFAPEPGGLGLFGLASVAGLSVTLRRRRRLV